MKQWNCALELSTSGFKSQPHLLCHTACGLRQVNEHSEPCCHCLYHGLLSAGNGDMTSVDSTSFWYSSAISFLFKVQTPFTSITQEVTSLTRVSSPGYFRHLLRKEHILYRYILVFFFWLPQPAFTPDHYSTQSWSFLALSTAFSSLLIVLDVLLSSSTSQHTLKDVFKPTEDFV